MDELRIPEIPGGTHQNERVLQRDQRARKGEGRGEKREEEEKGSGRSWSGRAGVGPECVSLPLGT